LSERERRFALPSSENDALSHALALVVTPLLLGLLGVWIDRIVGTGWVFAALLATFGVVGAFTSAYYRYEARMAKHDEGKPWTRRSTR
jgi:positive regulator of sigma E activity